MKDDDLLSDLPRPSEMQRGEQSMAGFTKTDGAPSLQEMLADPIVQTMMDNDGVTKEDVTGLLRSMRERMANRADEHHKTRRAQGAWRP